MKKIYLFLLCMMMILMAGCGVKPQVAEQVEAVTESTSEEEPEEPEEEEAAEEEPEEEAEAVAEDPFGDMGGYDEDRIVNNGTYFVKKGNDIYYRLEGEDTICASIMGHSFLKEYGPDVSGMGSPKRAKLMKLHTDTGEQEELCEDRGYGKLYFCRDRIYTNVWDTEESVNRVFATKLDGSACEELCEGTVSAVSDDNEYLIITVLDGNEYYHKVYKGDSYVGDLKVDKAELTNFCGTSGDYAFLLTSDYDTGGGSTYTLWCAALSTPAELVNLGNIPAGEDGSYDVGWPDITQVLCDGDVGYFSVSFYEGSGAFYQSGIICRADLYVEDSLKLIRDALTGKDGFGVENYIWVEDDELKVGFGVPMKAAYDSTEDSILLYDDTGVARIAAEKVLGKNDTDALVFDNLEAVYYIDGEYYMVHHKYMDDPAAAIGWRSVCDRIDTKYERIDVKGDRSVISEVPGTVEKTAYLAKGSDKTLYFVTEEIYSDSEHKSEVIGKGTLDDKGAAALSKLTDHDIPDMQTASISSNGYLGMDADYEFDGMSDDKYLITFGSDAKICGIKTLD